MRLLAPPSAPLHERIGRLVVVALLIGVGIQTVILAVLDWPLGDLGVYLDAAHRIRDGADLYEANPDPFFAYWYAPWFAYAWVPISYLPDAVVAVAWPAVLLAATALVAVQLVRASPGGLPVALLVTPLLFGVSAGGNVQPLLVAVLMARMSHRDGPIWIGAAASLKITPILLAAVYVRDRAWGRAALAVGVAGLLWLPAPFLGFDLAASADWSRVAPSLFGIAPVLYVATVLGALAAAMVLRRTIAPLSVALASVLALPRLFAYDVTLLAIGLQPPATRDLEPQLPARGS